MTFKYGFIYKDVRYGWFKKSLFRLPFERNGRTYPLKEIEPVRDGKVYNIQGIQKTVKQLELITEAVDWEVDLIRNDDCPF